VSVGKFAAAESANLVGQKLHDTFVYPVIVRFDHPEFVPVDKSKQSLLLDGCSQLLVNIGIGGLHYYGY